ncbi:glycine zipper family protein [Noviherbaspirillum sp. Root189]|uniref:glycine zipper family protein n=1 Tax=Noviherbaspirillum sp. Root189 TaxID=1736487 RepID=UPI00070AE751|nr:glycine zipper family protein [Noviherbaspirillum sp. Root189]KRB88915.1 hypothetical protein ASE07_01850 [Noviherbaspirillum sp. Root189]
MTPHSLLVGITLVFVAGCTTVPPNQPSVMVLPGTGKSFEEFRADNELCRQFASEQVSGGTPDSAGIDSGTRSAALGTLLGAAAGAAINGGRGAAVGAGSGLALGGLAGAGAAESSSAQLQRRYDIGFQQCMYAKGHRIPSAGGIMGQFFRDFPARSTAAPPLPPPGRIVR